MGFASAKACWMILGSEKIFASAFSLTIQDVIVVAPEKQVDWLATRRIVA
jgi:hypothetical protein